MDGEKNAVESLEENAPDTEDAASTTPETEQVSDENAIKPEKKRGGNLQAALAEERNERKRLAAELKTFRERQEKLDSRLKAVFTDEVPEDQEPQFEEDPASHLKQKTDKLEKDNEQIQNFFKQQKAMQELGQFAQSAVAEVKKEAPDYDQAYNYIRTERVGELMVINDCSETEAQQLVNEEELNFTINCAKKGKNPAKALYAYAKKRGFKGSDGEGGAEVTEAEKTLSTIEKGMNGSKSLSSASGKSTKNLTAEALAAMTDDEFSEFKAKNPRKFKEIMGASA